MGDWGNNILTFIVGVIPELIGAGFGAYLGLRFGLRQERSLREEEEKERKDDILKSLITEAFDNKSALERGLKEKRFSDNFNVTLSEGIYSTDAFDSTIFSGSYQLLTVETQRHTTWFFNGCKRMNLLLERLEYGDISENEARYVSGEIIRYHTGLKGYADDIISRLQGELGYAWTIRVKRENENE